MIRCGGISRPVDAVRVDLGQDRDAVPGAVGDLGRGHPEFSQIGTALREMPGLGEMPGDDHALNLVGALEEVKIVDYTAVSAVQRPTDPRGISTDPARTVRGEWLFPTVPRPFSSVFRTHAEKAPRTQRLLSGHSNHRFHRPSAAPGAPVTVAARAEPAHDPSA